MVMLDTFTNGPEDQPWVTWTQNPKIQRFLCGVFCFGIDLGIAISNDQTPAGNGKALKWWWVKGQGDPDPQNGRNTQVKDLW